MYKSIGDRDIGSRGCTKKRRVGFSYPTQWSIYITRQAESAREVIRMGYHKLEALKAEQIWKVIAAIALFATVMTLVDVFVD
jgi:hypothetical protein